MLRHDICIGPPFLVFLPFLFIFLVTFSVVVLSSTEPTIIGAIGILIGSGSWLGILACAWPLDRGFFRWVCIAMGTYNALF